MKPNRNLIHTVIKFYVDDNACHFAVKMYVKEVHTYVHLCSAQILLIALPDVSLLYLLSD